MLAVEMQLFGPPLEDDLGHPAIDVGIGGVVVVSAVVVSSSARAMEGVDRMRDAVRERKFDRDRVVVGYGSFRIESIVFLGDCMMPNPNAGENRLT